MTEHLCCRGSVFEPAKGLGIKTKYVPLDPDRLAMQSHVRIHIAVSTAYLLKLSLGSCLGLNPKT